LVKEIYLLSQAFPDSESFGLTSQIRRAIVSVPSNIAEGHSRRGLADYINFVSIAIGSLAEVETQLILAHDLGYTEQNQTEITQQKLTEVQKMLTGLRQSLQDKRLSPSLMPSALRLEPQPC
jgi:four helix bundle protein